MEDKNVQNIVISKSNRNKWVVIKMRQIEYNIKTVLKEINV